MSLFFDVLKDKEITVKCNKCSKQFISKLKYFISNQTLSCPYCRNQVKNKLPEEVETKLNLLKHGFDMLEETINNLNLTNKGGD